MHIRKLYEPHLFRNAPVIRLFNAVFGVNRSSVCTFGFEPNPQHADALKKLERAYSRAGFRVKIFHVAASNREGNVSFVRDVGASVHKELGSRITDPNNLPLRFQKAGVIVTVRAIDFSEWLISEVIGRELNVAEQPFVLAKSDMEEHDDYVWAGVIAKGAICDINYIYGEHSSPAFIQSLKFINKHAPHCNVTYVHLDDETYHNAEIPLPAR
jgi:hypothetical protein